CTDCHPAPAHTKRQEDESLGCATCHHEHRGKPRLAEVSDEHCIQCHADLAGHAHGDLTTWKNVTAFSGDHPEFKLFRVKPEELRAPGAIHFSPKGHVESTSTSEKLTCQSCHTPDRTADYMQPIRYQVHCQRCHQLDVGMGGQWRDPVLDRKA